MYLILYAPGEFFKYFKVNGVEVSGSNMMLLITQREKKNKARHGVGIKLSFEAANFGSIFKCKREI